MTSFMYDLGLEARDPISGFTGIIISRVHHLFGCSQYGIAPTVTNENGTIRKTEYFDEARIEILGDGMRREGVKEFDNIFVHQVGLEVRDKFTGFEGKIAYRVEYMYGCNQYAIFPSVDNDGKSREGELFDEGRIEVIGQGLAPREVVALKRGGINRDAP